MEFTVDEILDEHVCKWCSKQDCVLRSKITDMTACKNLEFDPNKKELHDAWNSARMKISLVHALCCSNEPHMFDEKNFRDWVKITYKGKKIQV